MTADRKVPNEEQESVLHHKYAVVVQDLATQWIQSYPRKTESAQEMKRSLRNFFTSRRKTEIDLYGQLSGTY